MLYTFSQLEQLWIQAGGNPQNAAMAAAIAMAESGGDPQSTNDNGGGSIDRGLWQINSSNGALSTYDPMANARAAVQMSNGGSNWRPWCTAYSDHLCGTQGGTYLGAGSPFMQFLGGKSTGPLSSGNSGGVSTPAQQVGAVQGTAWYDWLIPFGGGLIGGGGGGGGLIPLGGFSNMIESGIAGAISDILKPIGRVILHTMFVIGGMLVMGYAISLMAGQKGLGIPSAQNEEYQPPEESEEDKEIELKPKSPVEQPVGSRTAASRRRGPSPSDKSSEDAPGRHRGAPAREGRTQKVEAKAKTAAKVAAAA